MRKLVLYTLMSLDGAVDDPGRFFAGTRPNAAPEFDVVMLENAARIIGAQDAVLMGRRMYDEWAEYWPKSDEQPFADFINSVPKYVVTSSPLTRSWHNSEAVDGRLEDVVRDLKERPGRDIGVHGSIELAQSLLAARLVNEMELVVAPAFGFPGRRLFDRVAEPPELQLRSARATPSGSLLLSYGLR